MENKEVQTEEVVEKDYIAKSGFNVGGLIWGRIIAPIISMILLGVVAGMFVIIPVIGLIVAIALIVINVICGLSYLIDLIQYCFVHVTLNDKGIVGRGNYWKKIDLTYDQITMLECKKKTLVIYTNIPKNEKGTKTKKYNVCNIKNYKEFYEAYSAEAAKVAAAKVVAENTSAEAEA